MAKFDVGAVPEMSAGNAGSRVEMKFLAEI